MNTDPSFTPNYKNWLRKDFWTIEEAIALLLNVTPSLIGAWRHRYSDKCTEYFEMIDTVYKAQGLSLEMLEQSDFNIEGELIAGRIIPVTFTRWAEAKGYEIPDELQKLVETKQSMDSRERTSLLLIINALLIEATYGSNEPHNAAKELVRNMALKDIRVPSERTVAKKIKAARQLHEEETR